jgi:beta-glucosidase-like glycosyl hydrolase
MQLSSVFPVGLFGADGPIQSQLDEQLKQGIGHVAALGLIGHKTPEQIAKSVNAVQRYLVTQTRLKIPAIFHNEAMSGVVAPHFTQFPTSIGLAATWTPRRRRKWLTSSDVRCARWASSKRSRPSSTWRAMPAGGGRARRTEKIPTS